MDDEGELKEIYELLSNHYVEDGDSMFRCGAWQADGGGQLAAAGSRRRRAVWAGWG